MEEKIKQANPTIHKYLFTVTTFSKLLAMFLFIILPFVGFYLGMQYQEKINTSVISQIGNRPLPTFTPTPTITVKPILTPSVSTSPGPNENLYLSTPKFYSIIYPKSWVFVEKPYGVFEKNNGLISGVEITNMQKNQNYEDDLITINIGASMESPAYRNFAYAGAGPDAPKYSINGYMGYREQKDANGSIDKVALNNPKGGSITITLKVGKSVDIKEAEKEFQSILDSLSFIN